ncbi:MAG: hypothetical protein KDA62_06870, partial [Planctomycetales bacterium]|nr:hypothetical protein [Planctomycetales bacterium]
MIRPSGCRAAVWLAPVLVVMGLMAVAWPSAALAQLPATRLAQLFPSGSQVGASTEVVIAGNDLDDVKELHFSHPGITAQPKMAEPGPFDKGPVAVPNTFVVSVAGNVPPGLYEARAVGRYGISNPRAFVVTELKQASEVEPNNEPEQATELAWPGEIAGRGDQNGDVDYFKFTAKPNERIIINCLARRIDSRMDPLLVIYDAAGRELQSTREGMRGDPVLDFIVPAAGDYLLKVFDTRYNGGDDYFYRLRVGTFPHLDFVFPPAGQAGGNRAFTVFGRNLPGGQPAGLTIDGRPLQKLNVNVPLPTGAALDELTFNSIIDSETAGLDGREYRLNSPAGWSNPLLVGVASSPVVLEQEPNNAVAAAQAIQTPCEVAGQFYPARDLDWFQFSPKAGETYVVELISQRLGRPTDPSLIVEQVVTPATAEQPEVVRTLASVDDAANSGSPEFRASTFDPAAKFTIPDDFPTGGIVRVLVRDGYSEVTGDPRNAYRLVVRPPQPDFRLVAAAGSPQAASLLLRKGGCVEVRVVAFRQDGFDGEIKVTASGLPGGVTCAPAVIGPGVDSTTLVLVAAENAPAGIGLVSVTGEATLPSGAVKHTARFGTPLWPFAPRPQNNPQPPGPARLARNLAVSVSADEVAPVLIQSGGNQPLEASRGAIVKVPYTVTRRGEFNGNVACIVEGLPAGVNVQPFTINGNQANGEFQLTLTAATPPGTYSIWLAGLAQPMPYERNPEAAKRAAECKAELDAIVVDLTKKSTDATAAKTAADKVATDAMAAVQAATTAKENADKAAAEAKTAADAAADSATKAKAAAAATP